MPYKQEFWGLKAAAGAWTLFTPPVVERGRYVLHITQAALAGPTRTTHTAGLRWHTPFVRENHKEINIYSDRDASACMWRHQAFALALVLCPVRWRVGPGRIIHRIRSFSTILLCPRQPLIPSGK